ncbi:MAG: CesT family type III secretion system chaperone [Bordetella sp.]|nr:CesT family type III secretion system chaperone [Bordetella sp.]
MNTATHPLIQRYVQRHQLPDAVRADGRATLLIDERFRVHLTPAPQGWLALNARLLGLPAAGRERDDLLGEVGQFAAGMLAGHASTLVVDPAEEAIGLQQMIRPDASDLDVDEAVGQFANALSFWQAVARRYA